MPDTTMPDDYEAGSPEAAEWQAIHERNTAERRALAQRDRLGNERAESVAGLRDDARMLAALTEEHSGLIAKLATSGWLLFPDVSTHQGAFNWQWVKDAGMRVGAYKVSEGRTYLDGQQARNRDEIRRLGLVGMCYSFAYWSAEYDANPGLWNEQGRFFAQHAPADYAHVIDVEMLCSGRSTDVARIVAGYRSVYPNHPLMIYTNRSLYASRSKGTPSNPASLGLLLWHAGIGNGYYTSATGSLPAEFNAISGLSNSMTGFPPEIIWQFTDHGAVAGQLVDGNAFKGTVDDFRRVFITGGVSDDMSQADVDAIKAYIDSKLGTVPAAVWNHKVGSAWNPTDDADQTAAKALLSTQRYTIYAGYDGKLPGTDTPTLAARLLAGVGGAATAEGLRSVAASATAQRQAIAAQLDPGRFADAFIGKLGGAGGTLTADAVKEAAAEAFAEQLAQVRLGVLPGDGEG